jgi:hypothetical protein
MATEVLWVPTNVKVEGGFPSERKCLVKLRIDERAQLRHRQVACVRHGQTVRERRNIAFRPMSEPHPVPARRTGGHEGEAGARGLILALPSVLDAEGHDLLVQLHTLSLKLEDLLH